MKIFSNDYLSSVPKSGEVVSGGTGRFAAEFSNFVVENNHEWVGLIEGAVGGEKPSMVQVGGDGFKKFFELKPFFNIFNTVTLRKTSRNPRTLLKAEINLIRDLIKSENPDVVFLNGFYSFTWLIFEAAHLEEVPIVIRHAGVWAKEIEQYSNFFPSKGRQMCHLVERESAEHANINIFSNQSSYDVFVKELKLLKVKNKLIIPLPRPSWVKKLISIERKSNDVNKINIGVIARWDKIKNHEAVLALAKEIKKQKLDWKIKSVTKPLSNGPEDQFYQEYKNFIEIIPPIPNGKLNDFFKQIDLLIVPSHFETGPTVVMEAFGCGKPVLISPNVGWVNEYKRVGAGQWIVNFGNPGAVVSRIKGLFVGTQWDNLNKLSKDIYEKHDPGRVYGQYLNLFESLVVV